MTACRIIGAVTAGVAVAVYLAACTNPGAVVTGTEAERDGSPTTLHYADCKATDGHRYRVQVSAQEEYQLHQGQPCPAGAELPLAEDQYPQLYHEMQQRLPYGGGDANSPDPQCAAWQTIDKNEARRMAQECPPLLWGDLGGGQ